MNHQYHFATTWRIEALCGEVADVLGDPLALPRWWPSVYLSAVESGSGDAHGLGRRVALITKGWLPYTWRWELEVIESRYPHRLAIAARGDFDGRGVWTFEQEGPDTIATYDWRVQVEKPLVRRLSFLLKPLFEANHRWAMAQGEESLKLELARRRATSDAALRAIPPPPGPITYAGVALIAGGVAAAAGAFFLLRRATRRRRRRDLSIE